MALAGEVRAVADPDRQRLGAERLADLDAFEIVLDRLPARRGVGVRERAELVGERLARLVLEGVGVHRVEAEAERRRLVLQFAPGRRPCPRGCAARRVGVARVSCWMTAQSSSLSKMLRGSPGPGKRAKRVPPVPTPQEGIATPKAATLRLDRVDVDAAPRQLLARARRSRRRAPPRAMRSRFATMRRRRSSARPWRCSSLSA